MHIVVEIMCFKYETRKKSDKRLVLRDNDEQDWRKTV